MDNGAALGLLREPGFVTGDAAPFSVYVDPGIRKASAVHKRLAGILASCAVGAGDYCG